NCAVLVSDYDFDRREIADAMVQAKTRGCDVRLVTDGDTIAKADADLTKTRSQIDPAYHEAFTALRTAGIEIHHDGKRGAIMHDKFAVVDGLAVWTGSWNFTTNDSYRYDNAGIAIESAELAAAYTATFDRMFERGEFGPKRGGSGPRRRVLVEGSPVEVWFSPEDGTEARLVELLGSARTRIDFLAFSFTDDEIGAAVRERAAAGVAVRGVFEKTGSLTKYSEYGAMRKAGLKVLQDGNAYLMHIKAFIVDGRYVAFGSYNFTKNARTENDENLLVVDDVGMAKAFEAEFERVWARAEGAR
ncbi:MAG TPA: phospholipase D-like domain-containing protein, partial [Rectinemataceae bacterium]|nr:phospholipase D-like domain-containing protein [Rectinemataceae bacterium]